MSNTENDHHPLDWYAEFLPIEERARRGLLSETLTIAEIAALHPWGDKFACMLLEAAMISANQAALEWAPVENKDPFKRAGKGLHHEISRGFFDRIRDFPDLQVDPPASDPRNGHYYIVGRDDLKDWLQEVGLWPLPEAVPLRAWWPGETDPPASADAGHAGAGDAGSTETGGTGRRTRYRSPVTAAIRACVKDYRKHHDGTNPDKFQCWKWMRCHAPAGYEVSWSTDGKTVDVDGKSSNLQDFGKKLNYVIKNS